VNIDRCGVWEDDAKCRAEHARHGLRIGLDSIRKAEKFTVGPENIIFYNKPFTMYGNDQNKSMQLTNLTSL
jgi:hypothetical protein